MLKDLENTILELEQFSFEEEAQEIVYDLHQDILELIKYNQLAKGISGDGKPVTLIRKDKPRDYYSKQTVLVKEEFGVGLGAVTDVITNYMSGELYDSLAIQQNNDQFNVVSDSFKFDIAKKRSGEQLFDLNESSKELLDEKIVERLKERFNQKFNGV